MINYKYVSQIIGLFGLSVISVSAGPMANMPAHVELVNNTGNNISLQIGGYDNIFYYDSLKEIKIKDKESKEVFLKENLTGLENFPVITSSEDPEKPLYTMSFTTKNNTVEMLSRHISPSYTYTCKDDNCTNPTQVTLCTLDYFTKHSTCNQS